MGYTKHGATIMSGNMKQMLVMRWDNNIPSQIEVIYKDKDMTEIKAVFHEEMLLMRGALGGKKKETRKFIGDDIEWDCDNKNFKVLNDGKYVDEGDEEDKYKNKCDGKCGVVVYGCDLYCDDCLEALEEQNDEEEEEEVSEC